MYSGEDIRNARFRLRKCTILLLSVPAVLLALYVWAILAGLQWLMLAALLAGFAWILLLGDLLWLPARKYACFLQEMDRGLRRSTLCILERIEAEVQLQDGVHVRCLHARLAENRDSRIYYVNTSKLDRLPPMGEQVLLTSYGRHVVDCEAVKE